jgi:hypothetical protein
MAAVTTATPTVRGGYPGGRPCGNDARSRGTTTRLSAPGMGPRANLWARGDHAGTAPYPLTSPFSPFSTIHSPYYGHWTEIYPSVKESEQGP